MPSTMPIVRLSEMVHEQEGDLFVLMTAREELTTRDGKPYVRVAFRDARREVSFPIWDNSPWAADCRQRWKPGVFYKVRAMYRETSYGPQLELRKVRETCPADVEDGFDPTMCLPHSRFAPEAMYAELMEVVAAGIPAGPLRQLVETLLAAHRHAILVHPAARRHHHAFCGGWLEHTLSMARTCALLADQYTAKYPDLEPPLDKGLVVAGAVLHDLGKLEELRQDPADTVYTAAGALLGHVLLGRDMVRAAAAQVGLDSQTLLCLEHVIVAHQRGPEAAPPKPPMTPEALIVHAADDLDVKFDMLAEILRSDKTPGPLTSDKNLLRHPVYRRPAP